MNWDDMKVFLAVARSEGLSTAGRKLRMDPATVGRRVARLEEQLGQALFAKSPQGYALTDAGSRLLPHAETAEQAMQAAAERLTDVPGTLSGQIRIGAPDGCANFLLPQVCARIARANPELEVQIVALPRVVNLSKREADMAIAVSPPTAGRLSVQKVTDYHLRLAATQAYLQAHPPINRVEDLRSHQVVGYIPDMIFDKELDYLGDLGLDQVSLASNSVVVQFQWLRQGAGIGMVHTFAMPSAPDLRVVLADQVSLRRSFYLVRHADDRRLERLNRFAETLSLELKREVMSLESLT